MTEPEGRIGSLPLVAASLVAAFLVASCAPEPSADARPTVSTETDLSEAGAEISGRPATVDRVLDGDSLRMIVDGVEEEVRLESINAPERDECLGDASRDRLRELVSGAEIEVAARGRDQFGRLLAIVVADGVPVNVAQVLDGLAIPVAARSDIEDLVIAAEESARRAAIGLWDPTACGSGPVALVRIVDVAFDPPGPDGERLDEEAVTIANEGAGPVDLEGWGLRDESTANRFRFPPFVLAPGTTLMVVTGCAAGPRQFAWCAGGPVWNNGGDTALLVDPQGRFVDVFRYRGDR